MCEEMRLDILEAGVKALCRPIEVAAKRFAKRSERTGALRASLTTKTVKYQRGQVVVGLVGPDRAYYSGKKKVGLLGALLGADKPANYAHLVEHGHYAVMPRKGQTRRRKTATVVSWVPAKPFMRPAALTTSAEQSAAFFKTVDEKIDRAFQKLKRS